MAKTLITNAAGQPVSEASVLSTVFRRTNEETVSQFMAQIKAMTPEAKTELANDAARYLGHTVTVVG